ncbi:MAG: polysaccharide biosynthesis tyrosine autokinase [Bacteroidota bacterium]
MKKKKPQVIKPEDVRLVLKLLVKNWYFLLTIPTVAAFLGYYYSYKLPNIYQLKTEMLLKSEKYDYKSALYQGYVGYDAYAKQTNQERVLKSFDLISEAVRRMDIGVSYFNVGRIRTTEMYRNSPFAIEISDLDESLYERPIDVRFEADHFLLEYKKDGVEKSIKCSYRGFHKTRDISFFIKPTFSGKISDLSFNNESRYQFIVHHHDNLVNRYRSGLAVEGLEYTSIITITLEDVSEQRGLDFLDTLNLCYNNYSVKERIDVNTKTIEFIDRQLKESLDVINNVEYELEDYKAKESILNLNKEETIYYEKLVNYDEEFKKLELQLKTIAQLEDYINTSKEGSLLPPSFYVPAGDAYLSKTLEELYDMQTKKNASLYDLKDDNPMVKRTEKSFELARRDMLAYLENTKRAIRSKMVEVAKTTKSYENLLRSVPKAQRDILNIERRIAINEKLYNYLLEQRANVIIERATITPESEIIDKPRSQGAIKPNRDSIRNNYIIAGVVIVIGIIVIRFFFIDKYESPSEIKAITDIPVIGGIPHIKKMMPFNSKDYVDSDLAEGVRRIRTNLQFMGASMDKKIILVTSMFPSEGKTFTSVNLAYLNALTDKKVLLVDFDMHKPNIHRTIKIGNTEGLSNLLSGTETDYKQLIHKVHPNLDVITAGPVPPNASELVMMTSVTDLLEDFRANYDIIILDTPPLHLITDARILMAVSEINLMILNVKNATKNNLSDIEAFYEEGIAKNFAIVLNGVKMSRFAYLYSKYDYKYAYKYGYSYGYGYGYKYGKDA